MKNYMEAWNEIIDYVEGISLDIIDIMTTSYTSDDEKESELKYSLAIYSLMLIKNFSIKS